MDFSAFMVLSGPPAWAVTIFLGLVMGSFASAMTWRIPRNVSWVSARSACPSCTHVLSVPDLVPVLSWVFLRGRCRHCRAAIGWRYPLIELTALLTCLIIQAAYGFNALSLVLMLAVPFLVALVAIDLEFLILPDQLNAILAVLGIFYVIMKTPEGWDQALVQGALAAIIYSGLIFATSWSMSKILKKDAMGFGDVKFFAVAGLWLGLAMLPAFLILSGMIGVAMGLFWKIVWDRNRFPFGPALIMAFTLCLLFSQQIQAFWPVLL